MKTLAVLVAVVAASPAWSQNSPMMTVPQVPQSTVAPAAADQTLGAAHMFALVRHDGTLVGGSGAVSAVHITGGVYEVIFERSVVGCALTSTAGLAGNDSFFTVLVNPFNSRFGPANTVRVHTSDPRNLALTNASFHLTVLCAK